MTFEVDYSKSKKAIDADVRHSQAIFAVEVVAAQMYDGRRNRKFDWSYLGESPDYDAAISLLKEAIEMMEWRKANATEKKQSNDKP